jgi:peptidoglycan hydrolase-like protein with peptidoglycan-binding domain
MTFYKKAFIFLVSLALLGQSSFTTLAQSTSTATSTGWPSKDWWGLSSNTDAAIDSLSLSAEPALAIPVLFGVTLKTISPNFGDAREGGTRIHLGEDIMAPKGTPIVTPTKAVVLRLTNGPNEGLTIYTANPGGETFIYMHLDKYGEGVSEGKVLEPGDLIGYVGNTGNASGGASHLHFEIHNATGTPVDPFPRLGKELTSEEKILFLNKIFSVSTDTAALAANLVSNFKSELNKGVAAGFNVPQQITSLLGSSAISSTSSPVIVKEPSITLNADAAYGETSSRVSLLQHDLIAKSSGTAQEKLALSGATGYFGTITRNALIEYQNLAGINANGVYDAATKQSLESKALPIVVGPSVSKNLPGVGAATFNKDLSVGMKGDDVKNLQVFLNTHGFVIAAAGAGSKGAETTYFGLATKEAVKKFQQANNISPVSGYVGPLTRVKLSTLLAKI